MIIDFCGEMCYNNFQKYFVIINIITTKNDRTNFKQLICETTICRYRLLTELANNLHYNAHTFSAVSGAKRQRKDREEA